MNLYLDTSTVLRILLRQPKLLVVWAQWEHAYASELLHVEACLVIDRLRLEARFDDDDVAEARQQLARIETAIAIVALSRPVLDRAALPMATAVKTFDAVHLATAMLLRELRGADVSFATHDPQQARGARALGFQIIGV